MTYTITSQCIQCHRCESSCPTGAITQNEYQYQINAERCNDCVGHYAVPQCWAICPTHDGCIPLMESTADANSYWDTWFATYNRLVFRLRNNQPPDYWQRWFETYSQALSKLQTLSLTPSSTPSSTSVSVGANA